MAEEEYIKELEKKIAEIEYQLARSKILLKEQAKELSELENKYRGKGKKIQEQELLVSSIAKLNPSLMYIFDVRLNRNVWSNKRHEQFFLENYNVKPDEITIDFLSDIVHPDDWKKVSSKYNRIKKDSICISFNMDIRLKKESGWIWMHLSQMVLSKDERGTVKQIVGVLWDINDRKQVEEDLRFQSSLLARTSDLVVATDVNGTITYVNDAVCSRLKRDRSEFLGKNTNIFGHDIDLVTQEEIRQEVINKGYWIGEVINFSSEGERIILESNISLLKNKDDAPIGMIGISREISGREKRIYPPDFSKRKKSTEKI